MTFHYTTTTEYGPRPLTPRLLDTPAAAEYLSISVRHLKELRYHRTIPATKVGRSLRWDVRQLDRYIEENTEGVA